MTGFQQHLSDHWQAQFDQGHCHFPSPAEAIDRQLSGTLITPLSQYGLVSVEGPDAQTFLQGQTTCDFRVITPEHSCPGAYCTPKGRMLATFHAGALGPDHYLLRMRRDLVDNTLAVLGKYVVFSKAELTDISPRRIALGISGDQARTLLEKHVSQLPDSRFASVCQEDILVLQLDDDGQRFECWVPEQQAPALWDTLAEQAQPAPSTLWDLLNIRAGIGEVCNATRELFIPQVINFELTGGVSFKKGCYTGQEVVARMHYRGQSKRRMFPARLSAPAPEAGSELFIEGRDASIGHVVTAFDAGDHSELLVSVTLDARETGGIHLKGEARPLTLTAPPYSLEKD